MSMNEMTSLEMLDLDLDQIEDSPQFLRDLPAGIYQCDMYTTLGENETKDPTTKEKNGIMDTKLTTTFIITEVLDVTPDPKVEEGMDCVPKAGDMFQMNYFYARGVQDYVTDYRAVITNAGITKPLQFIEQNGKDSPVTVAIHTTRKWGTYDGEPSADLGVKTCEPVD